ncbi:MAG: hypothetical protein J1F23_00625 [Oscillospiraceae bacterium]|nr:hypothetical protein [Oscillospiraceae bacterium]
MAEKIPDLLIDEILETTKEYSDSGTPGSEYSADDIDRLIAEISGDSKPEVLRTSYSDVKKNANEPSEEKKAEKAAGKQRDAEELRKKVQSFSKVKHPQTEMQPLKDEKANGDVSVLVDDDGQLGLAADGAHIGGEAEEKKEKKEEKKELKSVSGQISIEKTRLFNEVKIRGEYNPNISHNLGNVVTRTTTGEAEPLSTPVMGEEKYRKHFMNRPVQRIEKTQEHIKIALPKTVETPGVVVRKNGVLTENTDGIQPIPTIVSAQRELERERSDQLKINKDDIVAENQIMLEGFSDDIEPVMQQSEEQAEAELYESRKEIVDEFVSRRTFAEKETDDPAPKRHYERRTVAVAREFFGPKDKTAVLKVFANEKAALTVKIIFLSVLCAVMGILSAIAGTGSGNFELYGGSEYVYVSVQILLLLAASVISFSSFGKALRGIKSKTVDMNTVIAVSAVAGLVQCLVAFGFADDIESSASIIAGAAVLPMIANAVGELIRCKNDIGNFAVISDEEREFYSVENIGDEDTANEIARGLMLGDPDIKYSAKVDFPARFVEISRSAEVTGSLLKIAVPLVLAAAIVMGLAYGFVSKNIFAAVSVFAGAVLMGLPVSAGILSAVNLSAANKKLRAEGTVINGYSAVEDAVNSNGVIIDACDAFVSGACNIEGIKLYHKMRIDEAILYTASVIIASGGVLSDIFNGVIVGKKELLLPVETLAYEERLGCSCWINNYRVLVGNRELLMHHNVEIPDKELEEKYKSEGRNVIYLALEGKIAAMFVVVYKADEETAKYMRRLEKDGITIFFRTSDANITEEFLEKEFGLPSDVIKIINPVAGDMFTKIKNESRPRSDAKIIHNGSVITMLKAIHSALGINSFINVSRVVQLISASLGVVLVTLLAFLSGLSQVGFWQIIIYQAMWAVILSLLPIIRKI